MLGRIRRLEDAGLLGMNRRNLEYIFGYNPRQLYPLVDDKLKTKQLAMQAGIAIPPLYEVIEYHYQLKRLAALLESYPDFVIKPAHGSRGDGIVLITQHHGEHYRKINDEIVSLFELQHHISSILGGLYSLGGQVDSALIEYRIQPDPVFSNICYQGVPDIRIIVFQGVPVMAMLRLPTRQSQGKANLHQGALGVGIDLVSGETTSAVFANQAVSEHPDTGKALQGISVPHWEDMLLTAARCFDLTGLGFIGADFILDKDKGPLLLELNARPGLNIQIANHAGLLPRLQRVQAIASTQFTPEQRVAYARQSVLA